MTRSLHGSITTRIVDKHCRRYWFKILSLLVPFLLLSETAIQAGPYTARTDAICKQPLEARRALAGKNDPDGIYCLAVLYAYRYGDETYPPAERQGYRAAAITLTDRAAALGYPVDDLRRHIIGGDNITNTGSYYGHTQPDAFGQQMDCSARVGIACGAQCGDTGSTCYSSCIGGNAWQCR